MKIVRFDAQNIKRLSAVTIEPSGSLVEVSGKNGAGKSSVLDGIYWALAGKSSIDERPIRDGEDRALIKLDLGDVVVTRSFRRNDSPTGFATDLVVESAEGARFSGPQEMLDALCGSISFDPLLFETSKPDERFAMIRRLLPDIDFEGIEGFNAIDYDARAEQNRAAKDLAARASAIAADMSVGDDLIDVDKLTDDLAGAAAYNGEIERRIARRASAKDEAENKRKAARQARARADELREEADLADAKADKMVEEADALDARLAEAEALPTVRDVTELRAAIDRGRAHNEKVALRKSRLDLFRRSKEAEAASEALTAKIEARKEALRAAVAAADFPVTGVAFEGRNLLLDGVPFSQASDAQRLRASISIAMALNPKLRVIRVRDGSRLDEDNLRLLGEMAAERDLQVWIEMVRSDGAMGIVIEDGHVKGQDPAEVLAAQELGRRKRKPKGE